MSNKLYDALKFIAQIALPATGTLVAAVSGLWGWSNVDAVVGTILAADLFLGTLLGLSAKVYNNSDAKYGGEMNIEETDEKKLFTLSLNVPPEEFEGKQEVLFKVNHPE